jgi:hypothetical protein
MHYYALQQRNESTLITRMNMILILMEILESLINRLLSVHG